jgi:hypothetical protein
MQMTLRLLFNGQTAIVGCQSEFDSGVIYARQYSISPTQAVVVWTELIDLHHAVEGERDRTERHRKFDYCFLPCMQFMKKSSSVALLVGRTNAIASIRLE